MEADATPRPRKAQLNHGRESSTGSDESRETDFDHGPLSPELHDGTLSISGSKPIPRDGAIFGYTEERVMQSVSGSNKGRICSSRCLKLCTPYRLKRNICRIGALLEI